MQRSNIKSIQWNNQMLVLLDQRALPQNANYLYIQSVQQVADAIRSMAVRGAPAIGICAAYGVVLAAMHRLKEDSANWKKAIVPDLQLLHDARPTAVNLHWALQRMRERIALVNDRIVEALLEEAQQIHAEDMENNLAMATLGAELLDPASSIMTHCNTGSLATGGYGTALGVIRSAYFDNKVKQVYAGETRPWLQGARLTAWELSQDDIPVTLICDSAAALLFAQQTIDWVIVGADRVAANGDVANKIGTYALAVLARHHGVKFMVVAPSSTIDMDTRSGKDIHIEERASDELLPELESNNDSFVTAWNPVFDITPADYIDALVTERGLVHKPGIEGLASLMCDR